MDDEAGGALGVIRFGSSKFGYPRVSGSWLGDGLFYRGVMRSSRFKGMQFASTGAGYTRNDPAYTLPQRSLDPVGVGNGVDWDYGLGPWPFCRSRYCSCTYR